MKHKHHIVPRHMGGSDDPTNLVEVSVEEHAELHLHLYLSHGRWQDWTAAMCLSGQATVQETTLEAIRYTSSKTCAKRNRENNPMWSAEVRAKCSATLKASWAADPEKCKAVGERQKKVNTGKKRTPEQKARYAEAARKRWANKKARQEQSERTKKGWEKRRSS